MSERKSSNSMDADDMRNFQVLNLSFSFGEVNAYDENLFMLEVDHKRSRISFVKP